MGDEKKPLDGGGTGGDAAATVQRKPAGARFSSFTPSQPVKRGVPTVVATPRVDAAAARRKAAGAQGSPAQGLQKTSTGSAAANSIAQSVLPPSTKCFGTKTRVRGGSHAAGAAAGAGKQGSGFASPPPSSTGSVGGKSAGSAAVGTGATAGLSRKGSAKQWSAATREEQTKAARKRYLDEQRRPKTSRDTSRSSPVAPYIPSLLVGAPASTATRPAGTTVSHDDHTPPTQHQVVRGMQVHRTSSFGSRTTRGSLTGGTIDVSALSPGGRKGSFGASARVHSPRAEPVAIPRAGTSHTRRRPVPLAGSSGNIAVAGRRGEPVPALDASLLKRNTSPAHMPPRRAWHYGSPRAAGKGDDANTITPNPSTEPRAQTSAQSSPRPDGDALAMHPRVIAPPAFHIDNATSVSPVVSDPGRPATPSAAASSPAVASGGGAHFQSPPRLPSSSPTRGTPQSFDRYERSPKFAPAAHAHWHATSGAAGGVPLLSPVKRLPGTNYPPVSPLKSPSHPRAPASPAAGATTFPCGHDRTSPRSSPVKLPPRSPFATAAPNAPGPTTATTTAKRNSLLAAAVASPTCTPSESAETMTASFASADAAGGGDTPSKAQLTMRRSVSANVGGGGGGGDGGSLRGDSFSRDAVQQLIQQERARLLADVKREREAEAAREVRERAAERERLEALLKSADKQAWVEHVRNAQSAQDFTLIRHLLDLERQRIESGKAASERRGSSAGSAAPLPGREGATVTAARSTSPPRAPTAPASPATAPAGDVDADADADAASPPAAVPATEDAAYSAIANGHAANGAVGSPLSAVDGVSSRSQSASATGSAAGTSVSMSGDMDAVPAEQREVLRQLLAAERAKMLAEVEAEKEAMRAALLREQQQHPPPLILPASTAPSTQARGDSPADLASLSQRDGEGGKDDFQVSLRSASPGRGIGDPPETPSMSSVSMAHALEEERARLVEELKKEREAETALQREELEARFKKEKKLWMTDMQSHFEQEWSKILSAVSEKDKRIAELEAKLQEGNAASKLQEYQRQKQKEKVSQYVEQELTRERQEQLGAVDDELDQLLELAADVDPQQQPAGAGPASTGSHSPAGVRDELEELLQMAATPPQPPRDKRASVSSADTVESPAVEVLVID